MLLRTLLKFSLPLVISLSVLAIHSHASELPHPKEAVEALREPAPEISGDKDLSDELPSDELPSMTLELKRATHRTMSDRHYSVVTGNELKEKEDFTCPICLESLKHFIENRMQIVQIHCGAKHLFCKDCITKHYNDSDDTCPVCKAEIQDSSRR